jgi:hypothetical protein
MFKKKSAAIAKKKTEKTRGVKPRCNSKHQGHTIIKAISAISTDLKACGAKISKRALNFH